MSQTCLIVLRSLPCALHDSHLLGGSARAGGDGPSVQCQCWGQAGRGDHAVGLCLMELPGAPGCNPDISIYIHEASSAWVAQTSWRSPGRKWLKIRSFALVEIVVFQNLHLSSRGWRNELFQIFPGLEIKRKRKKKKRAAMLNSENLIFSSHTLACALWSWWGITLLPDQASQEVSCQAGVKLLRFG